jgi:nitroreductase/NAD-dependent dihydropyrimidine dehydrogenase PreA subunit
LIEFDRDKCTRCLACYEVCPSATIGLRKIDGRKEVFERFPESCIACGHCMAACDPHAITHELLSYDDFEQLEPVDITPASMRNLLLARRSVRKYKKDQVPDEVVDQLIEVATHAGTGGNFQTVGFTVIKDGELLDRLEAATHDVLWNSGLKLFDRKPLVPLLRLKFGKEATEQLQRYHDSMKRKRDNDELAGGVFRGAPMAILAHDKKNNNMGQVNCAIAIRNIEVIAMTLGLGTCWAGFLISAAKLKPKVINEMIDLDESRGVYGALMVGYPKYEYDFKLPRVKRRLTEL